MDSRTPALVENTASLANLSVSLVEQDSIAMKGLQWMISILAQRENIVIAEQVFARTAPPAIIVNMNAHGHQLKVFAQQDFIALQASGAARPALQGTGVIKGRHHRPKICVPRVNILLPPPIGGPTNAILV